MSREVDEKVVSMQFDNKNFERNVNTSISTLDRLKNSLKLDGAVKGFSALGKAADSVNMSGLSSAVETVQTRFSALDVMAVTALANITNAAINAGKHLLSSFTIEPIKTGFNEFELKMGSIQTIMASTGESLDTVNRYLNELNEYSDRTIYSFADMTQNIGKFTNAGVKLEDAVLAIKGISNEAAVSGANANEASRAMYNFAQALSAGYVKLIDWKSIENANMATVEFKQELINAAVAAGTLTDAGDGLYRTLDGNVMNATKNFNDTLQDQWMTTDVLINTLRNYADETTEIGKKAYASAQDVKTFSMMMDTLKEAAQSGWAQTWELIIGDFEQGKTLWTKLSEIFGDIISKSAESRNNLLQGALQTSKWDEFIEKVNDAGIATEDFEAKIIEVAKEHGIRIDELIEQEGSLSAVFENSRISTNSIVTALKSFAGAETDASVSTENISGKLEEFQNVFDRVYSGEFGNGFDRMNALKEAGYDYAIVQELVNNHAAGTTLTLENLTNVIDEMSDSQLENLGYTEEQIAAIRELSDQAENAGTPINDLINSLEKPTGRELLIESFMNSLEAVKKVFGSIQTAWEEVFPPITSDNLYHIIELLHSFSEKIILSDENVDKLTRTFKGVFSAIDVGFTVVKELVSGFARLIGSLSWVGSKFLDVTSYIGDFISDFRESVKETDVFGTSVDKVVVTLEKAIAVIKTVVDDISEKIEMPGFEGFLEIMKTIWDVIKNIGNKIMSVCSVIGNALSTAFRTGDIMSFLDLVNGGLLTGMLVGINKLIHGDNSGISEFIEKIIHPLKTIKEQIEPVTTLLDEVKGCLVAWQQDLKANILIKIAGSIAILTASLFILSTIDPDKLNTSLGAVTMMFVDIIGSLAIFDKLGGTYKSASKAAVIMLAVSFSVLILAGACKKLSSLSWGDLAKGLSGVTILLYVISELTNKFSGNKKMISTGIGLIAIAAAMKILASVCKDMSSLSWNELAKGLSSTVIMLYVLSKSIESLGNNSKRLISAGIGMIALAAAMKILASVCKDMSSLSWNELAKGLSATVIMLYLLTKSAETLSKNRKGLVSAGIGMIALAAAMKILASLCKDMSSLSWNELAKGLSATVIMLYMLTKSSETLSKNSKGLVSAGIGMVVLAAAMKILASVCKELSSLSWEDLVKGLSATVIILFMLTQSSATLSKNSKGLITAGIGMIAIAAAMKILASVCKDIAAMSWGELGKGFVAIAAAFILVGAAGALLQPLVPTILALAASFALLGVAALAIGAGLWLISTAFTALAVAGTAGATAIVASLAIIIDGIANLIPAIVRKLGEAIIALCEVIIEATPAISKAIKVVVLEVIQVLVECIPALTEGLLKLLVGVLSALYEYTPTIVSLFFDFLIGVINALAEKLPDLIQAAFNLLSAFFVGIIDALKGIDINILIEGLAGIGLISGILLALSAAASLVPGAMIGVLGIAGVVAEIAILLAAIGALAQIPGLNWLIGEGAVLLENIGNAIGGFVGGILGGIVSSMMDAISGSLPVLGLALSQFMVNLTPFIIGTSIIPDNMLTKVGILTATILALTAAEIFAGIAQFVTLGYSLPDLANDFAGFAENIQPFLEAMNGVDPSAIEAGKSLAGLILALTAAEILNGIASWFGIDVSFSDFGDQLEDFGEAICTFSNTITENGGIDSSAVTAASNAGKVMAELAKAIPSSGDSIISRLVGQKDLGVFGTQVESFGKAICGFSNAIVKNGGIDSTAVQAAADAGNVMAELAKSIPSTGPSVVGFFCGDHDLSTFGFQVKEFGKYMCEFSNVLTSGTYGTIDQDAIDACAKAGGVMAELAGIVGENAGGEGVIAWFTGEQSLSDFGDNIVLFGEAMMDFSKEITKDGGINQSAVETAQRCGTMMADLAGVIPEDNSWFFEESDMETFGNNIVAFGEAMMDFSESVEDLDASIMTSVIEFGNDMVDLSTRLEGLDYTGIATLTTVLAPDYFIDDLVSFSESAESVDATVTQNVIDICTAMADLANIANGVDFTVIENFKTAFSKMGDLGVDTFITTIDAANSKITQAAANVITMFTNALNSKRAALITAITATFTGALIGMQTEYPQAKTAGTKMIDAYIEGMKSNRETVKTTFTEIVTNAMSNVAQLNSNIKVAASMMMVAFTAGLVSKRSLISNTFTAIVKLSIIVLKSQNGEFKSIGAMYIVNFANGMLSKSRAAISAASNVAKASSSNLKSQFSAFYDAGKYLVQGFAAGISSNSFRAVIAATAMANAAKQAAKNALKINSPSKVFRAIGTSVPEGFAQGIVMMGDAVKNSSINMSETAIDSAKNSLSSISDVLNSGEEIKPSITPVVNTPRLDSRNFDLGTKLDVSLNQPINSLSDIISKAQADINASNKEVIDAITGLREDLNAIYSGNDTEVALYVDSKKLASSLARPMNVQLNMLSKRGAY